MIIDGVFGNETLLRAHGFFSIYETVKFRLDLIRFKGRNVSAFLKVFIIYAYAYVNG